MYSLRGSGVQVLNLVDVTDSTQWPTINTYCLSEGVFGIAQAAAGVTYSSLATTLNSSGVDSWQMKVLVGDWIYWNDTVNGLSSRMCAPATFVAAKYAAQSPHISALNKAITNVVATQRQLANQPYSISEIGALSNARLDVITNPCPGGNYFGLRSGRNAASSSTQNDDTYTRMTNYLSATLAASFGYVVGEPQVNQIDVTKITGETDTLMIPKNWEGTIEAERQDSTLDSWWAQWESDYFAGINRAAGTITETITESDGGTSVYRYTGVQFNFTDPGKKQGDQTVRQTFTFTSKRRLQVA